MLKKMSGLVCIIVRCLGGAGVKTDEDKQSEVRLLPALPLISSLNYLSFPSGIHHLSPIDLVHWATGMSVKPSTHNTRSATAAASNSESNLSYSLNSTLDQVKSEVEKVSAANRRTEEQLQMLMARLGDTNVSLLSMCAS